ncbi:hypothetical protein GCM10023149_42340 [Mucilaginibacter gynuensis]|uniref:PKD domain-containing protein n=1 Tax=Mucilaginibacter gynuensis TaxID=1302236 RepID=A0ABP8H5W8_9SPHI
MKSLKHLLYIVYVMLISLALFSCKKDNKPSKPADDNNTGGGVVRSSFSWTGEQRINAEITFVNESKNADTYKWDFGNGETSTEKNPAKVKYTGDGPYNVILTATKAGKHSFSQQTILIAADNKPLAHFSFTYEGQRNAAPAVVVFSNESVNADSYKWVINGQTLYDHNPKYTFTKAGDYVVTLTAKKGNNEASFSDVVKVEANNDPIAGFVLAYHPYPYTVNEEIQLVNMSKNADTYLWRFGTSGPPNSTDEHPVVKFSASGTYTISLTASQKGADKAAGKSINLKINP